MNAWSERNTKDDTDNGESPTHPANSWMDEWKNYINTIKDVLDGMCNGHYNRTPDLGKCGVWRNVWDLARYSILDAKVLDRNVTWLTKHKDTS